MKQVVYYFILVFALICPASVVFADTNELPEPLVGQAVITGQDGSKFYFGVAGNEAIFNYDPNYLIGFSENNILQCNGVPDLKEVTGISFCYSLDRVSGAMVMNSRTVLNGLEGVEVAALYWPNSVEGDVYSTSDYLRGFYFYGNNLNKSSTSTLSGDLYTWGVRNYELNKSAQSSGDTSAYVARINQLAGEAPAVSSSSITSASGIYLQSKDAASINLQPTAADMNASPEGKIWKYSGNLTIPANRTIFYHDKGTLIVDGNLTISSSAKIVPPSGDENSNLMGIIVKGNVVLNGNNIVRAPIFSTGSISINGNNAFLYGSYIANSFNISSQRQGVRFFYDYRLDSGWPPGFRYFNMPTAKNSSQ